MTAQRKTICNISAILLPTLLLVMCNSGIAGTVREKLVKTFRFRPGGEVSLSNTNGSVTVRTWSRDEVRVEAVKEVKASRRSDAEEFMKHVRILIDDSPDEIVIETDYPRRRGGGGGVLDWIFGGGRTPSVTVTYTLTVPRRTDLSMETVNGGVNVDDVEGRVEAETTNGRIEIDRVRGTVEAHTTNGSINAEVEAFSGDDEVYLKTVNGGITVYLPSDVRADVSASTTNGGIHTRFPLEVKGRWGGKNVHGKLNGGGGTIELRTVNGGIDIRRG